MGILGVATAVQFPIATVGVMWMDDLAYHLENNTTWLNMSLKQQIAWEVIPLIIMIPPLSIFYGFYRVHRKRLIINGEEEGIVTYVHGLDVGNSNIYDGATIIYNRCRHIDRKQVPQPLSGDYYKGKIVIYYKTGFYCLPWRWKRICVQGPENLRVGMLSLWVSGRYERLVRHPLDSLLHHQVYYNDIEYECEGLDMEKFESHHKQTIMRIQDDDINLLQANPSIGGPMVKDSLFVVSSEQKQMDIDLMPDEIRDRYLREAYATVQNDDKE